MNVRGRSICSFTICLIDWLIYGLITAWGGVFSNPPPLFRNNLKTAYIIVHLNFFTFNIIVVNKFCFYALDRVEDSQTASRCLKKADMLNNFFSLSNRTKVYRFLKPLKNGCNIMCHMLNLSKVKLII